MPGYLELAIGPMFSGKTTWLTNLHKQCTYCNMRVVVINFAGDTRYTRAEEALLSEAVAERMNLTRERVRQVEVLASGALKVALERARIV